MFTADNTEGFTATELATMNDAMRIRIARGESEKGASDAVNNAWFDGATVADLAGA